MSEANQQDAGETAGGADFETVPPVLPYQPVDRGLIRDDVVVKVVYAPGGSDFPAWMRGVDPMLAAEETNCLYHLFRMRRHEHPGTERWWSPLRIELRAFFKAVAAFLIVVLSLLLALAVSGYFLLMAAVLLPLIRYVGTTRQLDDQRLPRYILDVYSRHGYRAQAAIDLWMAGARGSDVLEAIYLERMLRARHVLTYGFPVLAAITWTVYIARWGIEGFGPMLATLTLPLFAYQLREMVLIHAQRRIGVIEMEEHLRLWRGDLPSAGHALIHGVMTFLIWALALAFVATPLALMVIEGGQLAGAFAGVCFLVQTCFFQAIKHGLRDHYQHAMEQRLAGADEAFSIFMNATVVRDDLGKAWATWYYQSGRAGLASGEAVVLSESWEDPPPAGPVTLPLTPPVRPTDSPEHGRTP